MKLLSGKRIGQSGHELTLAVFFSFFIHAAIVAAALFFYMAVSPKVYIPPFYSVKLVELPAEPATAPAQPAAPLVAPAPKVEKKAEPKKTKKSAPKAAKATVKKSTMPELSRQKQKQTKQEVEAPKQVQKPIPGTEPARTGARTESVNEPVSAEDFKFPEYLAVIRNKIEQNWSPPPGIKGTKAKVFFRILRSGRVAGAELKESSGNFYFDQAAVRAILLSSPFPEMPDGFYKELEDFSVDLMEKE